MARLRKGRANTARGDSGFYTHDIVAVCRKTKVRFSITVRDQRQLVPAGPLRQRR